MALIIEDGTGVANAVSYVTDADAQAYWTQRGKLSQWTALSQMSEREGKLIEAADFLNTAFRWLSEPLDPDQPMAFPRLAWDGVPYRVKQAQLVLAMQAISGPLGDIVGGASTVKKKTEKLDGVGEETTEYGDPEGYGSAKGPSPMIEGLLRDYVYGVSQGSAIQVATRRLG